MPVGRTKSDAYQTPRVQRRYAKDVLEQTGRVFTLLHRRGSKEKGRTLESLS